MIRTFLLALTLLGGLGSTVVAEQVQSAGGAVLRALDKMTDETTDITLPVGKGARFGHISIELLECRYPQGNAAADAYASLLIRDDNIEAPVFDGWMIASSPAVSAMEHRRYDVWVLRCKTS